MYKGNTKLQLGLVDFVLFAWLDLMDWVLPVEFAAWSLVGFVYFTGFVWSCMLACVSRV